MTTKFPDNGTPRGSPQPPAEPAVDVAVLTALEVERKAVCAVFGLGDGHRVKMGGRWYWRGRLPLSDGSVYEIVVAQPVDMGQVEAALAASDMFRHWNPSVALLVGIAASTAPESVKLGDVVIGRGVYYYEHGRVTDAGTEAQPEMIPGDAGLLQHLTGLDGWDGSATVARPDGSNTKPTVHSGIIASGEQVIAHSASRDAIAAGHRKILALEMEGYGFSQAARHSFVRVQHLDIRGICDDGSATKNDTWHRYAAAAAAAFAKHLLVSRPVEPRGAVIPPSDAQTGIYAHGQMPRGFLRHSAPWIALALASLLAIGGVMALCATSAPSEVPHGPPAVSTVIGSTMPVIYLEPDAGSTAPTDASNPVPPQTANSSYRGVVVHKINGVPISGTSVRFLGTGCKPIVTGDDGLFDFGKCDPTSVARIRHPSVFVVLPNGQKCSDIPLFAPPAVTSIRIDPANCAFATAFVTVESAQGIRLPDGAASLSGGMSCDDAQRKYFANYAKEAPPELPTDDGRVLDESTYLQTCNVPASMSVSICTAIQNGRAVGVTVTTNPSDPSIASCIDSQVRGLSFPAHPRLNVMNTAFLR